MTRPVLLDTDIGSDVDDAIALVLLLSMADALNLVAVTTVGSDASLQATIASRLLACAGRSEVEVSAGASVPSAGGSFVYFGHEPECVVEGPDACLVEESAPERIVRAARECEGLELVAIGPLTNLAHALALDPSLPRRVAGLTVMGGHVREVKIGDFVCDPGIDYNLCSDAAASMQVLGAGFATTLITADVTLETWLRVEEVKEIEAAGELGAALARQIRHWMPVQRALFEGMGGTLAADNAAFLHDPLALLSLTEPSCVRLETLQIVPTIQNGTLRTFEVDPSLGIGAPMRVATGVEGVAVSRRIVTRLLDFLNA